jgi:hypothetical protein
VVAALNGATVEREKPQLERADPEALFNRSAGEEVTINSTDETLGSKWRARTARYSGF